jgi:hypothetical protein
MCQCRRFAVGAERGAKRVKKLEEAANRQEEATAEKAQRAIAKEAK